MSLKESMLLLLEDVKKQEAVIEGDMIAYGELRNDFLKYRARSYEKKQEIEIIKNVLTEIGGAKANVGDSIHIKKLQTESELYESKWSEIVEILEIKEDYYVAIHKHDYEKLLSIDVGNSILAGIYFAFLQWDGSTADFIEYIFERKKIDSVHILKYLVEKALVESDIRRETERESEKTDNILFQKMQEVKQSKNDAGWKDIRTVLGIKNTQRVQKKYNAILEMQQYKKEQLNSMLQNLEETQKIGIDELKKFKSSKMSQEEKQAVREAQSWHRKKNDEINADINKLKKLQSKLAKQTRELSFVEKEIQTGLEKGIELERCKELEEIFKEYEATVNSLSDDSDLEFDSDSFSEEFAMHIREIGRTKNEAIERKKEAIERKVRQKEEKARKTKNLVRNICMAFPYIIVGILCLLFYKFLCSDVYYGTQFYWGNFIHNDMKVADGVKELPNGIFRNNKNLKTIILPESLTKIGDQAFEGCSSLKEVIIPENVESIGMDAFNKCISLETVEIHSKEITLSSGVFRNCGRLSAIHNKGNIPNFEDILTDSVMNCCSLDMNNHFDDLYTNAIDGVPLLENEIQFKNLIHNQEIRIYSVGDERNFTVDTNTDKIHDLIWQEESIDRYRGIRETEFSFVLERNNIYYRFSGYVRSEKEVEGLQTRYTFETLDFNRTMSNMEKDQYNTIRGLLDKQLVYVDNMWIRLSAEDLVILEAADIQNKGGRYNIPVKFEMTKPLGKLVGMGTIMLSEEDFYFPRLKMEEAAFENSLNLIGSYESQNSKLTVNQRFDECYSATLDGQDSIIILDVLSKNAGKAVVMKDNKYYSRLVEISEDLDGIRIDDQFYSKVNEEVDEKNIETNPWIGIWKGTYDSGVITKRYVLPIGTNTMGVLDFYYDKVAFGILHPTENPDVYDFTFDQYVYGSDSYINGEYRLLNNKTIQVTTEQMQLMLNKVKTTNSVNSVNTAAWSIYNENGEVKTELYEINENIPAGAFHWQGSSYDIYKWRDTWEEAKAFCESLGGHLAIINSQKENDAVYSYLTKREYKNVFIGATDAQEEGVWKWVDNQSMENGYSNWHIDSPFYEYYASNYGRDYAMFDSSFEDGTWYDGKYTKNSLFLCEWD